MRRINHSSRFIEDFYGKGYPSLSLNSFSKVVTGSTPSRSINEYWFNGSHPWVSAQDMGEKFVDSTAEFITDSGMATCKSIPAGSLLYVCRGSIGVMSINRIDCATNQSICSAIPDSSICKTEYLYYWLLYHEDEITSLGEGTSFKSLSQKTFANLEIQLPPIKEQLHFITLTQQADKSKFSDFKSRFIEMFETTVHVYEEIPITALCYTDDDIKCGPFGTQLKQSEYQENGVAVWGIPQINSGFSIAPDTFVTPEKAKRLEQFSLISGDIAMSRKGNVGQCALFPDNFEKGIIASDVVRIRVNKDLIMPQFLVYQLHNSHKVRRQILNVSDGSIMAGINVTKLKKIHVYSPPLERQKQFVSIVRQVDKSKYLN